MHHAAPPPGLHLLGLRGRSVGARLGADRPQRHGSQARGLERRQGTDHLSRPGQAAPRAGVGCDERARADSEPAPTQVQARLLGRVGHVSPAGLEGFQERMPVLRRPASEVARGRVHSPGRLVLGAAEVAADAAELRTRTDAEAGRLGAPPVALDAATFPSSRSRPTGRIGASTTSSAASPTSAPPCSASAQRRSGCRSTPSGATSMWTRSTRPTAAAGSARTAS